MEGGRPISYQLDAERWGCERPAVLLICGPGASRRCWCPVAEPLAGELAPSGASKQPCSRRAPAGPPTAGGPTGPASSRPRRAARRPVTPRGAPRQGERPTGGRRVAHNGTAAMGAGSAARSNSDPGAFDRVEGGQGSHAVVWPSWLPPGSLGRRRVLAPAGARSRPAGCGRAHSRASAAADRLRRRGQLLTPVGELRPRAGSARWPGCAP